MQARPRVPRARVRRRSRRRASRRSACSRAAIRRKEIAAAAEREDCDLIAMSTHGHRFIRTCIYGSVANEVRHISRVPVLLVRGDAARGSTASVVNARVTRSARAELTGAGRGLSQGDLRARDAPASAAGTNEIAPRSRIAPASVSGMVRRLAEQGLITHERYRGVRLTDAGRRAALRTIRRHRVIEAISPRRSAIRGTACTTRPSGSSTRRPTS